MQTASRLRRFVAALALGACAVQAQALPTPPAFEVASIKPSAPLDRMAIMSGKMRLGMSVDAARVTIGFMSLSDLIGAAYSLKPYQLYGPDWMTAQRFDIAAKLPEGATKEQVPAMLQSLLADRFKLTVHRETREKPVYDLVQDKGGSKLRLAVPDAPPTADDPPTPPAKGTMVIGQGDNQVSVKQGNDGKSATVTTAKNASVKMTMTPEGAMRMEAGKMDMAGFIGLISSLVDRPIMDKTELKGQYQVALELSMSDLSSMAKMAGVTVPGAGPVAIAKGPADEASDPAGSSVFTAVQKMGLKLVTRKEPLEFIVVDHLEKAPTEN